MRRPTLPRPESWAGALARYELAQRAAGRSPGTVKLHRHYLSQLRTRQRDTGRGAGRDAPWAVGSEELLELLATAHWAPETRKSCRAALRGFYRWGHGVGLVEHDPAESLPAVSVPAGRPRPTPEHLVRQLLAHRDERIGLMAQLAAYAGLRRGEIARVHARDVVGQTLVVHGKGGKVRGVPITDARLLWRLESLEGYAFPGQVEGHLSPGHVGRLLAAELPAGWTAHTLRHRFASAAYAGTRDLIAVSELLGHSRVETTQRYVETPDDALRAAVAAAVARLVA